MPAGYKRTDKNRSLYNRLSVPDRFSFAVQRGKGIRIETALSSYFPSLDMIRSYDFSGLSSAALERAAGVLKNRIRDGESPDTLFHEAYALTAEACRRTLDLDPFDVQLIAAMVLNEGKLAQMKTGEGKTLSIVFPAVLHAWTGKSVHILTSNDYLASRDARWMGPVYRLMGVETASVHDGMGRNEKKKAYGADVVYLTAKQGGFDYLSDGMCYRKDAPVQRDFDFVIVDEADSILIDEARIPLVIAAEAGRPAVDPCRVEKMLGFFDSRFDYSVDRQGKSVVLTLAGQQKVQELFGCGGMHEESSYAVYGAVHVALHAHELLRRDVDYIVRGGKIELVDGFTGRIVDRRRWPYGIQPALEAKEALELQPEGRVCGSITVQDYIDLYPKRAALTATAVSAAGEFMHNYGLATVVIPPNRPDRTFHETDRIFTTRDAKLDAVAAEIVREHETGRPILVGTASVEESEEIAVLLEGKGIRCQVLNAKNDEKEAELIARAGCPGAVTISTNMAGRGTDIRLGGPDGRERGLVTFARRTVRNRYEPSCERAYRQSAPGPRGTTGRSRKNAFFHQPRRRTRREICDTGFHSFRISRNRTE